MPQWSGGPLNANRRGATPLTSTMPTVKTTLVIRRCLAQTSTPILSRTWSKDMESLTSLEQRLEDTKRRATMYAALAEVLAVQLQAQQRMEDLLFTYPEINAERPLTAVVGTTQSASSPKRTRKVHIYTAILKSHGKPMHVSEILAAAQNRGVELKGTNPARVQLRNALFSSKNRFQCGRQYMVAGWSNHCQKISPRDTANECRHAVAQEEAEHAS